MSTKFSFVEAEAASLDDLIPEVKNVKCKSIYFLNIMKFDKVDLGKKTTPPTRPISAPEAFKHTASVSFSLTQSPHDHDRPAVKEKSKRKKNAYLNSGPAPSLPVRQ